ncbi:MAG: ABC transporter permease subunit [Gammaproteobacteria bacterium]|jgi:glycine betaine/proline transport system permease protein|nr:ABC transporter permease subunit [Gammaproteobacteria bacterium]
MSAVIDNSQPGGWLNNLWEEHRGWVVSVALFSLSLIIWKISGDETVFPENWSAAFPFSEKVDVFDAWIRPYIQPTTRAIAAGAVWLYEIMVDFLTFTQWQVVFVILVLPAFGYGGLRLGLLAIIAVSSWLVLDFWDESMETLSLMSISILLSIVIGVLMGIAASQNDRVEAVIKPILDTMQTLPAFVYLIPAFYLFGIGPPGAILATVIYALPPVVRLTNLGIRQVPAGIDEASTSFGATRIQSLIKVKLPLAMPSIKLGINQTVMMALALVVLATFIGSPGLGDIVYQGLVRLNVGKALEGGLAIVLMAVMLDRVTYAMGHNDHTSATNYDHEFRLFPQSMDNVKPILFLEYGIDWLWRQIAALGTLVTSLITAAVCKLVALYDADFSERLREVLMARSFLIASLVLIGLLLLLEAYSDLYGNFPRAWEYRFRTPVNQFMDELVTDKLFYAITTGIKETLWYGLINPLNSFLKGLPWWYTTAVFTVGAFVFSGRGLAVVTFLGFLFIGAADLWTFGMITLTTVTVSVLICFIIGVPLGILSAYNKTADAIIRPILDTMQTMPVFVYLVPVIMLFGAGQVPSVIATVIYALAPLVRCTTLGIRELPVEINEVSNSFGANLVQTLTKVKIPMAIPAIMVGINQGIMMALAMEVVTPLIGGQGLGLQVFDGMNRASIGISLEAGLGVVMLAIILDRLSQAWTRTQREAMGMV